MSEFKLINHEKKFTKDIENKKTFLIDTSIDYIHNISKEEIIEMKSLFSYLFEIRDNYPQHIIDKLYVCECERVVGQKYEGMICQHCGTPVAKIESTTSTMAYIHLPNDIKVLTPLGLIYLSKIIGKRNYASFLVGNIKIANKYKGYNYIYDHFDILIETYKVKSGVNSKDRYIKFMMQEKENLFTSYIPVISSRVRFMNITENMGVKNIGIHGLNEPYAKLSVATERLKQCLNDNTPGKFRRTLYTIQENIDQLKTALITEFACDKKKMLRDAVFGVRVGFTSMAVLCPLKEYSELDSCTIPMETFRVLFKNDIKDIMRNMGFDLIQIAKFLDPNFALSDGEKKLLSSIFDRVKDPYIYVNRQPTIAFESIMVLRIREIRDELVLRVHPNLLDGFRGDHDGDTPIMVGLEINVRDGFHKRLAPVNHITTYTGEFNHIFALKNDYQTLFTMAMSDDASD